MTNPEPSETLWNQRYSDNPVGKEASLFLPEVQDLLPDSGSAVDIAGGNGQNAIWFAHRGFSTTLIDISTVALEQAQTKGENVVTIFRQRKNTSTKISILGQGFKYGF